MLQEKQRDVGLIGGPGLDQRAISTTRLGVLLLNEHPLAKSSSVPVMALAAEHLVLLEPAPGWSIRRIVEDVLDRSGIAPREVTTVADGMTMLAFVAAGIGVGFASLNTAALTPRHLTLAPLAEGPLVSTSLVWKSTSITPALRTVINAAERHLVKPGGG